MRRHRASARCPCSFYRSLVCLVSLQRFDSSPHHPSEAAAHYWGLRRSSRAPWSPLLASLSSFLSSCPPPARHSVASAWLGGVRAHASCLSAEVNRPPTHASALGSFFGVLDRPGRITLQSKQDQPPKVGPVQKGCSCRRRPPPRPLAPLALLLRAAASGIMSVRASLPHHASGPRQHRRERTGIE